MVLTPPGCFKHVAISYDNGYQSSPAQVFAHAVDSFNDRCLHYRFSIWMLLAAIETATIGPVVVPFLVSILLAIVDRVSQKRTTE